MVKIELHRLAVENGGGGFRVVNQGKTNSEFDIDNISGDRASDLYADEGRLRGLLVQLGDWPLTADIVIVVVNTTIVCLEGAIWLFQSEHREDVELILEEIRDIIERMSRNSQGGEVELLMRHVRTAEIDVK